MPRSSTQHYGLQQLSEGNTKMAYDMQGCCFGKANAMPDSHELVESSPNPHLEHHMQG
jgi:hypothetical protein